MRLDLCIGAGAIPIAIIRLDGDISLKRFFEITTITDALALPDRFEELRQGLEQSRVDEDSSTQQGVGTGWIRPRQENLHSVADPDKQYVFARCNKALDNSERRD